MKNFNLLSISIIAVFFLCISCNDEWKDEQFDHYVSIKAPLDSKGVTPIYVRYKPDGKVTYQLPLIVSGSTINESNLTVHLGLDPDTLAVLNQERFGTRTELFYKQLDSKYFSMPETADIYAESNIGLMPINFSLLGLDLVNKWLLPLTILDDPSYNYKANDRKNYKKALLRILPFNNYSGEYSATAYKVYFRGNEGEAIVPEYHTAYVVDENTVFFYAGLVDEDRLDRKYYKVFVKFNDDNAKTLTITTDNPDIHLNVKGTPNYTIEEEMDATLPYLKHVYVSINMEYDFVDYTSVPGFPLEYTVKGTLIMERKINIKIPDEDQAIEW